MLCLPLITGREWHYAIVDLKESSDGGTSEEGKTSRASGGNGGSTSRGGLASVSAT